ncbi:MAG: penicillin-binding protein 2 [Pelotomaculum sp.]|uniref:Cell division protein n=1 Tax=Pelotomaculum thermopropionicum (strain DSM 13744 / JCM 10971 / SI) TaxID=370438 RepID=A5D3C8_PELTS|nr:penicillin-binding protein 2 [Pelotomaculum sp.]BAF59251.1 cell division protein [Pelotomaculum thermopropionicum SI]
MDILRQKRLVQIFFIFWLCFLGLIARLWLIQIRDGPVYSALALEQGSYWVSLEDAPRGKILDRNLVPIAGERREDRVVVFPMVMKDREEVARGLADVLQADFNEVRRRLEGGAGYLPYRVAPEQSAAIKERGWPGVLVLPVLFRYGERTLAAQTVGHLGKISSHDEFLRLKEQSKKIYHYGDMVGKTGLERYYEEELKGLRPLEAVRVFTDAAGRLLGGPSFYLEKQAEDRERRDLVLTIDGRIQKAVEDVMDRRVPGGAVVVMEAGTGDILAMASRPGFNPAVPGQGAAGGAGESFLDRCTALYQPGSIFKIAVAAAAIEEGIVKERSRFACRGEKDDMIRCWKDEGHGETDFAHAFAGSCNPAFAQIGLKLGALKLIEYAGRLGLDEQTVIGYPVPFDRRQDLRLIGEPYNLVNSSIGQGPVLVTPVQVASMLNAVVSGGIYRQPRLVMEVRQSGSSVRQFLPDEGRPAISPETAARLRSLLELVVDEGVGREAQVDGCGSAGKTGSAQTGDAAGTVHAWFAGYAPRANPRYIAVVLIEGGASGGRSAAPVFKEIMEQIVRLEANSGLTE